MAKAKILEQAAAAPAAQAAEKPAEDARARFLRLGPPRVESALKRINLVGNLAGSGYDWKQEEAQQMLDALFDAIHDLKRKFEKAKSKKTGKAAGFTFKRKEA